MSYILPRFWLEASCFFKKNKIVAAKYFYYRFKNNVGKKKKKQQPVNKLLQFKFQQRLLRAILTPVASVSLDKSLEWTF